MKWIKYGNIVLIICWLITGICELTTPSISKFSYACLWIALIVDLICDTIEKFIKENQND